MLDSLPGNELEFSLLHHMLLWLGKLTRFERHISIEVPRAFDTSPQSQGWIHFFEQSAKLLEITMSTAKQTHGKQIRNCGAQRWVFLGQDSIDDNYLVLGADVVNKRPDDSVTMLVTPIVQDQLQKEAAWQVLPVGRD